VSPLATAHIHRSKGVAAVTLRSGELEATFVPELNLLGTSLRLDGEEYLALRGGVEAYRHLHTTGLPLLAPWANRLGELGYRSGRVHVDLRGLDLHTDGRGLPIHGTLSARESWDIHVLTARGRVARLRASFEYARQDLLAAFPFPHRLETEVWVDGRSLSVSTTVRATGTRPVPVAFGYHPYLRLPRAPRARWRLRLPKRVRLELDEHGLPTGQRTEARAEFQLIGARTFDDLFELEGRTFAIESRGRRLSVYYGAGFRYAQVFAPPGAGFVCLEPMTAPTNALVTGGFHVVRPGEAFTARFRLRPERTESARTLRKIAIRSRGSRSREEP
jgi:aldose 1-epimerase